MNNILFFGLLTMIIGSFLTFAIVKYRERKEIIREEMKHCKENQKVFEEALERGRKKLEMLYLKRWALILQFEDQDDVDLDISDEWVEDTFSEPMMFPWAFTVNYYRFNRENWLYFRPFKASDGCYYFFGVRETEISSGDAYLVTIECFLRPNDVKPLWPYRHVAVYPKYMIEVSDGLYGLKPEFRNYTTEVFGR